jgi:hypothetical protein
MDDNRWLTPKIEATELEAEKNRGDKRELDERESVQ